MIPSSRTGPPLLMRRVDSIVAEGDESVYRADATAGNQSTTIGHHTGSAIVWCGCRLCQAVSPPRYALREDCLLPGFVTFVAARHWLQATLSLQVTQRAGSVFSFVDQRPTMRKFRVRTWISP